MPYHLFICRHAQAQNPSFNQPDFERQLTPAGIREAEEAGNWLQQSTIKPSLIICSSAQRTIDTALIIANKLAYNQADIISDITLYNASESDLLFCLAKIQKDNRAVLLVGHNPGVSDLINSLSGTFRGNIPTGSIHYLHFEMEDWQSIYLTTATSYQAYVGSGY